MGIAIGEVLTSLEKIAALASKSSRPAPRHLTID
jgi:hypothetical protein